MRLKKGQKAALLSWIAEGAESGELVTRAAEFEPPFAVSRQQVDYYRRTREVDLKAIAHAAEMESLTEGLALKEVRVAKLQRLAALMERDLFGVALWLDQVKSIGSGPEQQVVEYEEFNAAEVSAYRGVLDDVARETGGRVQKQETDGRHIVEWVYGNGEASRRVAGATRETEDD